jgi:hypothetical protein
VDFEDVVQGVFGVDGAGGIAVGLMESTFAGLVVSSRTYNQTGSGTFGQSIPGLEASAGIVPGETVTLTPLHENAGFRTNLGFLAVTSTGAMVKVEMFRPDGSLLREESYLLRGYEAKQVNRVFGVGADVTNGFARVTVTWGSQVLAYASVVDNRTGDPTYVAP